MSLENQVHKQLRNVVAEQMRISILEGKYKPGEWMRQERIAQELGVSQMPVREALKELASEGLIEHIPYRGARVVDISPTDVEDIYALRAFLESRAAYFAAGNITADEVAELKRTHAGLERNLAPEQVSKYRELNRRFHELVFTASRRPYLVRTLGLLWAAFPTMLMGNYSRTASHPLSGRDGVDQMEHAAIIAALEKGDATAAQKAMREHIETVMNELMGMIEEQV
jgi:DNA-binding GntR family transcriptional regulator